MEFHEPQMANISPVLMRRVNRVRERMDRIDPAEAVLDDVYVLWRAFEGTLESGVARDRHQLTQLAVSDVIEYFGIAALPQTAAFIESLRAFETASLSEFDQWFMQDQTETSSQRQQILSSIDRLGDAVTPPVRWSKRESASLGDILYRMRCAVIHPRLDTDNSIVVRVLPALRSSMIELMIARAAEQASIPFAQARAEFDSAE